MGQEIDAAYQRLLEIEVELRRSINEPLNESDVRFQILDRLLTYILGWHINEIHTEPPTDAGYIDYLVRPDDKRLSLIIEAKRSGKLNPRTMSHSVNTVSLTGRVLEPLLPTVKQALSYATFEGVPSAAVTDGNVWLFFTASRSDGNRAIDGNGILFPNFDVVKSDFPKFFELCARIAVVERRNVGHMAKANGLSIVDTEQQYFVNDPGSARLKPAQQLASDAALLFDQFFSNLISKRNQEMDDFCFVESPESKKTEVDLKKIAENLLNSIVKLDTVKGSPLQDEVIKILRSQQSNTILLIGNKGSGKSTFLGRFFRSVLDPRLRSQCAVIRIDFEGYNGFRGKEDVLVWVTRQLKEKAEKAIIRHKPPNFDDLKGIFFQEYQRWQRGPFKPLYDQDPQQFKQEFGRHIESLREKEPDLYIKLLLRHSIISNRKLPCLIFDNVDQFDATIQDQVYQLAHSLGTEATMMAIVPITDRTVWRLGKAGALQSYSATTFYLPVPEAKEIIARRVNFVKMKLNDPKTAHAYFSAKGFLIGTKNLEIIADAIENVLVQQDYVSGLVGRLGNFNIRIMLLIARRIFLSPELRIDEIVTSYFGGKPIVADKFRTYRALIKGQYDRYSDQENDFVTNLFATNPLIPTTPLLMFYILYALRSRYFSAPGSDVENRQWKVGDIVDYLEICGIVPDATGYILQILIDRALIEETDPNNRTLSNNHRVSIKDAGIAHIDLALDSSTYIEQMALSTGIVDLQVRDNIRIHVKMATRKSFDQLRILFLKYLLNVDSYRINIPASSTFRPLQEARNRIQGLAAWTR